MTWTLLKKQTLFGYFFEKSGQDMTFVITLWSSLTQLFHRSCVGSFIKMNWKLWVDVEAQTFNNRLAIVSLLKGRQCKQIYILHTMRHMFQIYLSPLIVLKCILSCLWVDTGDNTTRWFKQVVWTVIKYTSI